jgi:hypothetical protein
MPGRETPGWGIAGLEWITKRNFIIQVFSGQLARPNL